MGKKLPSSWFEDPEWEMLRRKAENKPISKDLKQKIAAQRPKSSLKRETPRATAERQDTDKEVVVNLKLAVPKLRISRPKIRFSRKQMILTGAALVSLVLIAGALKFYMDKRQTGEGDKAATPEEQAGESFNPLVPLPNLKDMEGNQVATPEFKYDPEKKVLGYQSNYNGAFLTISQQVLPEQLKTNPGQLEGIARSVNANTPIDTQKGKAYIATDEESKTQIAVFATDSVLVFARSNMTLDPDEWTFYINQLIPKN